MNNKRRRQDHSSALQVFMIVIFVMAAAVYSGYLGTKYIISPFFLGNGDGLVSARGDTPSDDNGGVTGEQKESGGTPQTADPAQSGQGQNDQNPAQNVQGQTPNTQNSAGQQGQTANSSGEQITLYTLKFGTFSTEENANTAVNALTQKSIYSYPVNADGEYRIYSLPFTNKDSATAFKDGYIAMGEDCFIVPREFTLAAPYSSGFVKDYADIIYDISSAPYTGPQRLEMTAKLLAELKSAYGAESAETTALIDKTATEAASITGSDNQILFQLQKTIIMNMSSTFA